MTNTQRTSAQKSALHSAQHLGHLLCGRDHDRMARIGGGLFNCQHLEHRMAELRASCKYYQGTNYCFPGKRQEHTSVFHLLETAGLQGGVSLTQPSLTRHAPQVTFEVQHFGSVAAVVIKLWCRFLQVNSRAAFRIWLKFCPPSQASKAFLSSTPFARVSLWIIYMEDILRYYKDVWLQWSRHFHTSRPTHWIHNGLPVPPASQLVLAWSYHPVSCLPPMHQSSYVWDTCRDSRIPRLLVLGMGMESWRGHYWIRGYWGNGWRHPISCMGLILSNMSLCKRILERDRSYQLSRSGMGYHPSLGCQLRNQKAGREIRRIFQKCQVHHDCPDKSRQRWKENDSPDLG